MQGVLCRRGLGLEYPTRRDLRIILRRNKLYLAFIYLLIKGLLKSAYGFRFGFDYCLANFRFMALWIYHGIIGRSGKVV